MRFLVMFNLSIESLPVKPGEGDEDFHVVIEDSIHNVAGELEGEVERVWWTLGPYDLVALVSLPDEQQGTAFSVVLSKKLRVRTTSMVALESEEMRPVALNGPDAGPEPSNP
jgi:GYD domain